MIKMYHYAGEVANGAVTLEKLSRDPAMPPKKIKKLRSMQNLYMTVHSSITHDNQKVQTTRMSTTRGMDK